MCLDSCLLLSYADMAAAQDSMRSARHKRKSRVAKMAAVINSGVYAARNMDSVHVSDLQKIDAGRPDTKLFNAMTNPNTHVTWLGLWYVFMWLRTEKRAYFCKLAISENTYRSYLINLPTASVWLRRQAMKREFQLLMKTKSKDHTWPSTTHQGAFEEFGAHTWLLEFLSNPRKYRSEDAARLTALAGSAGQVVASQSQARIMLILARSEVTFVAWELVACQDIGQADTDTHVFVASKNLSITFNHIHDLHDWVSVPCRPGLLSMHGPMCLVQCGEPLSLPAARIDEGACFTVNTLKSVLSSCGVSFPGNASRAYLIESLIDHFVTDDTKRCQARARMLSTAEEAPDSASDCSNFSEVLDMLEENENQGDQDVKKRKD